MIREAKTVYGVQTREAGAHDHNVHIEAGCVSHLSIMAGAGRRV
ncbi:hypothetical protein [Mycobacterium riyadhense]|nr:hypothetical protein [Mycobacterium riyadhense]